MLTKGELFSKLANFPDDTVILFNIDDTVNHNWDSRNATLMISAELCPGYTGCTHTEPEMDYEAIIFICK